MLLGLLAALVSCMSDDPSSDPIEDEGGTCRFTERTYSASDPSRLLAPELRVGDLLERVATIEIPLRWTGWADDYLDPTPLVGATTTLHVAFRPETITFIVRDSAFDDPVCHDWIEVEGEAEIATDDEVLIGGTWARVHVNLEDGSATLQSSASLDELGSTLIWPADDPRPVPVEAYLEFVALSPIGDFREPTGREGDVEMTHVWYVTSEGGFLWRVLEYFSIAELGA
ncbi:hypothetical protein ACNOYE_03950 [Nannocystaceae bacterium ST9]